MKFFSELFNSHQLTRNQCVNIKLFVKFFSELLDTHQLTRNQCANIKLFVKFLIKTYCTHQLTRNQCVHPPSFSPLSIFTGLVFIFSFTLSPLYFLCVFLFFQILLLYNSCISLSDLTGNWYCINCVSLSAYSDN